MIYVQTSWEEKHSILQAAIERGEMGLFVRGIDSYKCIADAGWSEHDVAQTVWMISKYSEESAFPQVWRMLEDELIVMSDDRDYCWMVVDYIHSLLFDLRRSSRLSPIGFAQIEARLRASLPRFESHLRGQVPLSGPFPEGEGMWGYILRLLGLIRSEGFDLRLGVFSPVAVNTSAESKTADTKDLPVSLLGRWRRWIKP